MPALKKGNQKMLTTREAAEELNCSIQHVQLLIRQGKLKAVKEKMPEGDYRSRLPVAEVQRYASLEFEKGCKRGVKHGSRKPVDMTLPENRKAKR